MIQETNVSFQPGRLKAADLQKLNDTVNTLVRLVNIHLKNQCNVNLEYIGTLDPVSFTVAIEKIPEDRQIPGFTIKFNHLEYGWSVYVWQGNQWDREDDWIRIGDAGLIDGGEIYD